MVTDPDDTGDEESDAPGPSGWGWMFASGLFTLALGAISILLPLAEGHRIVWLVGWLLLAGGLGELLVGWTRHGRTPGRILLISGAITSLAGLLFILAPRLGLFPVSYFVTAWLLLRGLAAVAVGVRAPDATTAVRRWLLAWGGIDLALGLLLLIGLPILAFLSVVFGPNIDTITSFGVVLALSFCASGLAFIEIALSRRRAGRAAKGG